MRYSCVPLGGLVTISGGGTPSRNNDAYWGGGIPWATVKDLKDTSLSGTQETITPEGLRNSASNLIPAGSVIVATRMGLGKVAINTIDVTINQDLKAFSCCADIEPRYLMYFLLANASHLDSMGKGATVKGITLDVLKNLSIPLPPLPEQKRIAAILDKADSIRRKRQEAIQLTEELLRSVFLDMFGDPVTNPKGWKVLKFGELCEEMRYGTSNMCSSVRYDGDLPVLRIPNVIGGQINWDDMKHVQLPDAEVRRLMLEQGDMLFVRTNGNPEYIGRCAVFDDTRSALYASYLIRARLKKESPCLPQYASSCFTFPTYRKKLVAEAKTTAGNFNINTEGLKSLKLPVPPLNLQHKFLTLRDRLSRSNSQFRSGVISSDALFNTLLQRAFKGEL